MEEKKKSFLTVVFANSVGLNMLQKILGVLRSLGVTRKRIFQFKQCSYFVRF